MAEGRKYAERSSTGIECPICMESFESIKILPCKHEICSECLDQLISRGNPLCPHCRNVFSRDTNFKIKEPWNLECFVCFKMKPSEEFNWCVECAQLLCCLCLVRGHKSSDHTIQEWDSGIPVMAALKSKYNLEVGDYPRQQHLLKEKILKLLDPVADSISKNMIDSRHQKATSLMGTVSADTEDMEKLTSNNNGEEVLCIAAKVFEIDVQHILDVPISLKDLPNIEDRVRSLMNFGPEQNFFDNGKDSKHKESAVHCSTTSKRDSVFKIKADRKKDIIVRISPKGRKTVLSDGISKHQIYDFEILDRPASVPKILNRSIGKALPSAWMGKRFTWDCMFDSVSNEYFVLEFVEIRWNSLIDKNTRGYFQLAMINLDSMKRISLWNSSKLLYGDGGLACNSSGVLFILTWREDSDTVVKSEIYTSRRNEQGRTRHIVLEFEIEERLSRPICYEIGLDTFLLANRGSYTMETSLYSYDGFKMTFLRIIKYHAFFRGLRARGRAVEYGNHIIIISNYGEELKAFTRDGHDLKASWEYKRLNTEIKDFAVDGNRVLMAFYEREDDSVRFQWFSLDELKNNSA